MSVRHSVFVPNVRSLSLSTNARHSNNERSSFSLRSQRPFVISFDERSSFQQREGLDVHNLVERVKRLKSQKRRNEGVWDLGGDDLSYELNIVLYCKLLALSFCGCGSTYDDRTCTGVDGVADEVEME
ncbi:hypothetical protein LR48_Vigan08g073200 [Vigna angularis]|uniref:Uncharacterized protein n=1 Tax=Phaseolus angularis TaxID=3914 RepID=A0A0L9V4B7_PHAAN|nr:hypothetical protein LR48_Vigan08g073200 [Vigna angularis]